MHLIRADALQAQLPEVVGGKAAALFRLSRQNVPVPDSVVIPTHIHALVREIGSLPVELIHELAFALDSLGTETFAVRSSADVEDGSSAAWAGQFDSFLDVPIDKVSKAVLDCFAAVDTERVRAYAKDKELGNPHMAVLIQPMVTVDCGGVLFTRHPVTGSDELIIEAVAGSGDAVVKGEMNPETYICDRTGMCQPQAGTTLTVGNIEVLVRTAVQIEKYFGLPQDIEWGFVGNQLHIFQSRPITALPGSHDTIAGNA